MTDAVVVKEEFSLAGLSDDMLGSDVLGYSEKSDDSLIPVLSILQDNSGEVKKKHERYIDGSEAGMFIIRSLQMVFPADEPILFQPCGFTHEWVEWTGEPGEGGAPVAQYPYEARPAVAEEIINAQGKKEWRMPESNNRLVETRHHFGNILRGEQMIPVVIAMSGTNHSVSRQWTALMKQFTIPGKNIKAPAFTRCYDLATVFTQKGSQSWYKFKVKDHGWINDANTLQSGFAFAKAIAQNEVKAGVDTDNTDTDTGEDLPI